MQVTCQSRAQNVIASCTRDVEFASEFQRVLADEHYAWLMDSV